MKKASPVSTYLEFPTKPKDLLTGISNGCAEPRQGLYIEGCLHVGDKQMIIDILIDSGASSSMMSEEVYNRIDERFRPELTPANIRVTLADGSAQKCLGKTSFRLRVGDDWQHVPFLIGNWTDSAILGMAELQALGLSIDFDNLIITLNDLCIPVCDYKGAWVSRKVTARSATIIPAKSQKLVYSRVAGATDRTAGMLILEPDPHLSECGIQSLSSLHQADQRIIPVIVQNNTDSDVEVEPTQTLGVLKNLQAESAEWSDPRGEVVRTASASNEVEPNPPDELPPHLFELYQESIKYLNEDQKKHLKEILIEFQDIFSKHNYDIGCTDLCTFSIDTGDHLPIKQAPRRLSPEATRAADEIIEELLLHKLIEKSDSPWASPLVLVKRRDGRFRMCIDFRQVNMATVNAQAWPMARIDDTLEALAGAKMFCTMDLTAGYWQVPMSEDSKWKTAFVHRSGLYHWNRKPFGVKEGPGVFSRMMAEHFRDMLFKKALVFLDDVILIGKSVEELLSHFEEYCTKIRAAKLKTKPSKCFLFRKEVAFLGHLVNENGVKTDPAKVEAVRCWTTPSRRRDVRSFLGLVNFYRRFIPNCSTIAKPLTALTSLKEKFDWTPECQESFNTLKEKLCSSPLLGYPREDGGQFKLSTDASDVGLGFVLSQDQVPPEDPEGEMREVVIAYGSRTLSAAERHYCVTRKELLAVVHGVLTFKNYLLLRPFLIRTDHSSLKYLHRMKQAEGQLARWLDLLQPFTFTIEYIPGRENGPADALSRKEESCGGKKCYCQTFNELVYEPPVVMEVHGKVDMAVQAVGDVEEATCEETLRCAALHPQVLENLVAEKSTPVQTERWKTCQIDIGNVTLFFRQYTPLSNFYQCSFVDADGTVYNCSEQFYQSKKATAAGEQEISQEIMELSDPGLMKTKTRWLKGLCLPEWNAVKVVVLEEACMLKFFQNPDLAHHLLIHTQDIIVEASPYDRDFGISMHMYENGAGDPANWRGRNEMGHILMRVRRALREQRQPIPGRAVSLQPLWTVPELKQAQESDLDIAPILEHVKESNVRPEWSKISHLSERSKWLAIQWDRLKLKDGLLRRLYVYAPASVEWYQLVLPKGFRDEAMMYAHDSPASGHNGTKRARARLQARFYWPGCDKDLQNWVATCDACQRRKPPPKRAKAPLQVYLVGAAGERVSSDLMGPFSQTSNHSKWIVVFIDHFTKFAMAAPLVDITAVTVATAFLEKWVCYFGIPKEFHSDKGTQYESALMLELCTLMGIKKTRTTAFRPQSDGLSERLNRTLCDMLNCVGTDYPFEWDMLLPIVTMAYNSSRQESTGQTPNDMVFGKAVTLPISLLDPAGEQAEQVKAKCSAEFVTKLQRKLEDVHHLAREKLQTSAAHQQKSYNNRLEYKVYQPGEAVYYWYPVKDKRYPKEQFFKWHGPYVVVERLCTTVYLIQQSKKAKPWVVNHDTLKPAQLRKPMDVSWIKKLPKRKEVTNDQAEVLLTEGESVQRPRRTPKAPKMYGDWFCE